MTRVSYQVALDLAGRQRMLNQRAMKEALATRLGTSADPGPTLELLIQTGTALLQGGEAIRGPGEPVSLPTPPSPGLQLSMGQANQAVLAQKALIEAFIQSEDADPGPLLDHGAQVHERLNQVCVLYAAEIEGLLAQQAAESERILEACQRGELHFRGRVLTLDPSVRASVESTNAILDAVLAPIPEVLEVLEDLGDGDLTGRVGDSYVGDHARLAAGLNAASETLNELLWSMRPVSEEVSHQAHTLQSTAELLATNTQQQASAIVEVNGLLNRLVGELAEHSALAGGAAQLATDSHATLARSQQRLTEFMQSVESLEAAAERITNFLGVIDDIAFQTDLLALNAAVEAARAGSHGSGFAVVAQEVRALALRSAKAASQMEEVVTSLDTNMHKAESLARVTAKELEQVASASHTLGSEATRLAVASGSQVQEVRLAEATMGELQDASANGRTAAKAVALASRELAAGAEELKRQQERFQLAPRTPAVAAGFDPELVAQVRAWLEQGAA